MTIMNSSSTQMYQWMKDLFPLCRSITGEGVRDTLKYFRKILPDLIIHEVPSGTQAFDWVVPDEWIIRDAYIKDESGKKIVDFQKNNLHLMGYSEPINEWMNLQQLNEFLYSIPEQPSAIPYITNTDKKLRAGYFLIPISPNQQQLIKILSIFMVFKPPRSNPFNTYPLPAPGAPAKIIAFGSPCASFKSWVK